MNDVEMNRRLNKNLTGKRIKCIQMNDEHPVESGTEGTVSCVDDMGTIHMKWDNGRTLGLIQEEDLYEIFNEGADSGNIGDPLKS